MAEATGLPRDFPRRVATLGSGPFTEEDFDSFLQELGVKVLHPNADLELVVVGREGWSDEDLEEIVQNRAGAILKVFSQEMLLVYVFSGLDPFNESEAMLRRLGADHPALEFLSGLGFDWPTTEAFGGGGGVSDDDWPEIGLLSHMGYRAGKTAGVPQSVRRGILRQVFKGESLPLVNNAKYMREWGGPKSRTRLLKLANTLSSFCQNEKRRPRPPWVAIEEREADLAWAKTEFYKGRFDFTWPSTNVR